MSNEKEPILDYDKKMVDYDFIIKSPSGYSLDSMLMTTFSLDLDILKYLLVKAALDKSESSMEELPSNLDVVRTVMSFNNKIFTICNRGQIYKKNSHNKTTSLLDSFVKEVKNDEVTSCFHPKIILLKFNPKRSSEGRSILRVCISSRNLTQPSSTHLEMLFMAEGEISNDNSSTKFGLELQKYLNSVKEKAGWEQPNLEILIDSVEQCSWTFPDEVDPDSIEFVGRKPNEPIDKKIFKDSEKLVISPFLVKGALEELNPNYLITSTKDLYIKEVIGFINEKCTSGYTVSCDVEDRHDLVGNSEKNVEIENSESIDALHAKAIFFNKDDKLNFFMGSSNCTNAGLFGEKNGNWEANVLMTFKKNKSIEQVHRELVYYTIKEKEERYGFYNLITSSSYEKEPDPLEGIDLPKGIKDSIHKLKNESFQIIKKGGLYELLPDIQIEGVRINYLINNKQLKNISCVGQLDEFLKIEIYTLPKEDEVRFESFTIKVKLPDGCSEERDAFIINELIKDKADLYQLILNQLAMLDGGGSLGGTSPRGVPRGSNTSRQTSIIDIVGIETLLKILTASKIGFEEIQKIVSFNDKLDDCKKDPHLNEFWAICSSAYNKSNIKEVI